MADYIVKDTELTSVANAIRTAGGTNSLLSFPNGFVNAVRNISGGGSSDFSTAEVTLITNLSELYATIYGAITDISSQMDYPTSLTAIATADAEIANGDVYTVALYNGYTYVGMQAGNITVSGNATAEMYDLEHGSWIVTVTGDCTITIS